MPRPITAELFTSLDLVIEEPQEWHFPWVGKQMLAEVAREQSAETLLLGRRTYTTFAASWPKRGNDNPLASQLNTMRKVVISDVLTPEDATWATTRVIRHGGDIAAAVRELAADGDGRVTVAGSVSLVEYLLAAGLLTELRLIVHPLVVGAGRRLFEGWTAGPLQLELVESTTYEQGARLDVYRPAHKQPIGGD